jgi:hypothetical protein
VCASGTWHDSSGTGSGSGSGRGRGSGGCEEGNMHSTSQEVKGQQDVFGFTNYYGSDAVVGLCIGRSVWAAIFSEKITASDNEGNGVGKGSAPAPITTRRAGSDVRLNTVSFVRNPASCNDRNVRQMALK